MQFERQPIDQGDSGEIEKGIAACLYLKEKEPDPLHWGQIDCFRITPQEASVIAKFDVLKKNPSEEKLFALDTETRGLLEATSSLVAEALINELVVLRYEIKHRHKNHSGNIH